MNPCGEIEFLKKSIGSVLVSALAEVCLKRPTDPIDFIANWLIKYRYNEALRLRDTDNAMRVFQTLQDIRCGPEMNWEEACGPKSRFNQGVNQLYPFLPPGYGMATEYVIPNDEMEEEELGEVDEYFDGVCSEPPSAENLGGFPPGQSKAEEVHGEDQDQASVPPTGQDEETSNSESRKESQNQRRSAEATLEEYKPPEQPEVRVSPKTSQRGSSISLEQYAEAQPGTPKQASFRNVSQRGSSSSVNGKDDPQTTSENPQEENSDEEEEET